MTPPGAYSGDTRRRDMADISRIRPAAAAIGAARSARSHRACRPQWLGVVPFFVFALLFLILPTLYLVVGAFQNAGRRVHARRTSPTCSSRRSSRAYWISHPGQRRLGRCSAPLIGLRHRLSPSCAAACRAGCARPLHDLLRRRLELRRRAARLRLPRDARPARPGHRAAATTVRHQHLRDSASTSCRFWGLTLTYLYFQIPLMVLIITPALDGLKKEWREAAAILGATQLAVLAHGRAPGPLAELPRHRRRCSSPTPSAPSPPPMR